MKKLIVFAILPFLLANCSEDDKGGKSDKGKIANRQQFQLFNDLFQSNTIRIQNGDGAPIADAQILIGQAVGLPFTNNLLTTNENGEIEIPTEWTEPLALTVDAPGFVRVTYLNQTPQGLNIQLRPRNKTVVRNELQGTTIGHKVVEKDGLVDFGIVIPAMTKLDIMNFDMGQFISPVMETIEAAGQEVQVPSNIVLPTQKESYGIFPVTLSKEIYRFFTPVTGTQKLFAARGRFPFRSVVDSLRNGAEMADLINEFRIFGGQIKDVKINAGSKNKQNFEIREMSFTEKRNFVAPQILKSQTIIAVSLLNQNNFLVPTDFKRVEANEKTELGILPKTEPLLAAVLKNRNEMNPDRPGIDRLSAVMTNFSDNESVDFLPLIPNPRFNNTGDLDLPEVSNIKGVHQLATYSVLSQVVEKKKADGTISKSLNRAWEVYSNDWLSEVKLPEFPTDIQIAGKKQWDVVFIGSQNASQSSIGPAMIDAATHVTHSSVQF